MRYRDFTEMPVWKLAFELLLKIYTITKTFPMDERFGLTSDMRRAANSITHNIAEGFGRYEPRDKTRIYKISRGSAYELMSQILVAHALSFIKDEKIKDGIIKMCRDIIQDINSIIKTLES